MLQWADIIIILFVATGILLVVFFLLNRWAAKKSVEQQSMIDKSKMPASIFVIDKKRDKAANVNLPKVIMDNLPKMYKFMKMNFVKAKIGPQIVTLICDKKIYNMLAAKKTYKVELAGIYIVSVKGMKTEAELKKAAKLKAAKAKEEEKKNKLMEKEAKNKK